MSKPSPYESPDATSRSFARLLNVSRIPPTWWWRTMGVWTTITLVLQLVDPLGDHSISTVVTLAGVVFGVVSVAVWFTFFSGYSLVSRTIVTLTAIAAACTFMLLYELQGTSADLIPEFGSRHRTVQRGLVPNAATADLASTTKADFPQFLGPERSAYVIGPKLARDWGHNPPKQLWRQPIGEGWSAFSAVNGFAVTMEQQGEKEEVTCYEVNTGRLIWAYSEVGRHYSFLGGTGPKATPTIHNGRVYTIGPTGIVLCLNGSDGALLWRQDLRQRYAISAKADEAAISWGRSNSPLIVDDKVIVPVGGIEGRRVSLAAFHAETGDHIWDGDNQQVSYSSPSVAVLAGTRQIVVVNESAVSGHNIESGEVLWTHPWEGSSSSAANTSQVRPISENTFLVSKGYMQGASLVELVQNAQGGMAAKARWHERSVLRTKLTNVVVHNGYAYGLSDGILECVELQSGKRVWKKGRYGHGQILGVDDVLLLLSEAGELSLVELTPSRLNELGKIEAIAGKTWNNLCLYGNLLLVRNSDEAACYELPTL